MDTLYIIVSRKQGACLKFHHVASGSAVITCDEMNKQREKGRGKEGRREGGKEGRREGGKEGRREGGKEGRREGGKEGGRESSLHRALSHYPVCFRPW
eukprot:768382-Hanusia_phi.AAC.5